MQKATHASVAVPRLRPTSLDVSASTGILTSPVAAVRVAAVDARKAVAVRKAVDARSRTGRAAHTAAVGTAVGTARRGVVDVGKARRGAAVGAAGGDIAASSA